MAQGLIASWQVDGETIERATDFIFLCSKITADGDCSRERDGWMAPLNEHEFEQALGDGEEQGSLVCCIPWGHKELNMTE